MKLYQIGNALPFIHLRKQGCTNFDFEKFKPKPRAPLYESEIKDVQKGKKDICMIILGKEEKHISSELWW